MSSPEARLRFVGSVRGPLGAIATALFLLVCVFYPFLPGRYDMGAAPVSTVAQLIGLLGLPLVPLGLAWLIGYHRARRRGDAVHQPGPGLAVLAVAWGTLMALIGTLLVLAQLGAAGAVLAGVASILFLVRSRRLTRDLHPVSTLPAAPCYMVVVPTVVLLGQLILAGPATRMSRDRAIANSSVLLGDLERFRGSFGYYPETLLAVNRDYKPGVIGIEGYDYSRIGNGFNLVFEQPRLLIDEPGVREFVVYNPLDEHVMLSHAEWYTSRPAAEVAAHQGGFPIRPTEHPHWKSYLFD